MLRLTPFRYLAPTSVHDAILLLETHGSDGALMGGGTDLFPNIKHRLATPKWVIGLAAVDEMQGIFERPDGSLRIGAGVRLRELESDSLIRVRYPALAEAAGLISTPQVRRMGTVGGNICLDARCNYYNQSEHWRQAVGFCMKNGSDICRVAPGSDRCWAISSSDTVPVLLAHDAAVTIAGPAGQATLPLSSFYRDDGLRPTILAANGVLTEVILPPPRLSVVYSKLRIRMSFDFPLVGVATGVATDANGIVTDARIIVTATGSYPLMVTEAQSLLYGNRITGDLVRSAGEKVFRAVHPLDNTEGAIPHRKRMAQVYVERALRRLGGLESSTVGAE